VRPALGVYKCFGCGESGDVISFVQKTRGLGFKEALALLAERAGIELASMTEEQRRRQAESRRSRATLETGLTLFRQALRSPAGQPALDYVRGRGFSDETLARFDIGFIPTDFLRALRAAGAPAAALEGAGFTAAFGGRLGFGIRDGNGVLVGFGARRLSDEASGPKYVNTRETPWFSKGRLLYGLDKATRTVARTRRLVVMEGYTDVMMAHQRGVSEAVASMGTSFTAEHVRLVRARVGNLVLVFDGDEPGRAAAERAVRRVLEEGVECRVLLLPGDMDPCDWFAAHTAEEFEAELERQAIGSVGFLCRRLLEQLDRDSREGASRLRARSPSWPAGCWTRCVARPCWPRSPRSAASIPTCCDAPPAARPWRRPLRLCPRAARRVVRAGWSARSRAASSWPSPVWPPRRAACRPCASWPRRARSHCPPRCSCSRWPRPCSRATPTAPSTRPTGSRPRARAPGAAHEPRGRAHAAARRAAPVLGGRGRAPAAAAGRRARAQRAPRRAVARRRRLQRRGPAERPAQPRCPQPPGSGPVIPRTASSPEKESR
jgi:DNA primase catalytic core